MTKVSCGGCGNSIPSNASFCPFCGTKIGSVGTKTQRLQTYFEPQQEYGESNYIVNRKVKYSNTSMTVNQLQRIIENLESRIANLEDTLDAELRKSEQRDRSRY